MKMFLTRSIIVLFVLFFLGCSINDPEIPGWESKVKVHFRTDEISMEEVLTESSFSSGYSDVYGDTLIYVSINDTTEAQSVKPSDLAFKADDDKINETVGVIELENPDPVKTGLTTIDDIFPDLNVEPGTVLPPLDAQVVDPPPHQVEMNKFQSVTIDSADMYLVFYNNMILDIDSGLKIKIYDAKRSNEPDRGIIDSVIFNDPIPTGASATSSIINLAGKSISNQFQLDYKVPIAATSDSRTLTADDISAGFDTEIFIENLKVLHAVADVPQQDIPRSGATAIDTKDKSVNFAEIDNGSLNLAIHNYLEIDADLNVTILNMQDEFGEEKKITVFMPAKQTTNKKIDISGYSIKNRLNPGEAVDSIRYEINAISYPSNGPVIIDSEDSIVVDISMDSTYVSYFEGSVENLEIDIEPVEETDLVDYSSFEGEFTLPDLVLTLNLYNEMNFDINIDLLLSGENKESGERVEIPIDTVINKGTSGLPGKTVVVLNGSNTNPSIVDLMRIQPTSISIAGDGFVDGRGSVALSDKVWADYSIESPLKAIIDEPVYVKTDIDSITRDDLSQDERDRITQDIRTVSLFLNSINGLPLGADFSFAISNDSTNMFDEESTDSTRILLSSTVISGNKNSDGLVLSPKTSENELALTPAQLQLFNKSPLYYGAQIKVRPQTQPVLFRKNDVFKYNGYMDVRVKVDVEND
ncbi:MAG: hypothetical protein KDF60_09240 [Calditrichaeota bacterium]|nr:hypothetical protein [Calditrichota bacterium]